MRLAAFVELTPQMSEDRLNRLVVSAFHASRGGTVGLALNGVPPEVVDRMLDPVVRSACGEVCGVWYLREDVPFDRLLDLASCASFVLASTETTASALQARGIAHARLDDHPEPAQAMFLSGQVALASPRAARRTPATI